MTPWTMPTGRQSVEALHRKYTALVQLAEERERAVALGLAGFDPAAGAQRRLAMRALATEFPGALRELDTAKLPELVRRQGLLAAWLELDEPALAQVLRVDPGARVGVIWLCHLLTREMLHVKRTLAAAAHPGVRLRDDVATAFPTPHVLGPQAYDASLNAALLHPPGGHLSALVYAHLAVLLGQDAAIVKTRVLGPWP